MLERQNQRNLDHRANQLNPNNRAYHLSRQFPQPPSPKPKPWRQQVNDKFKNIR